MSKTTNYLGGVGASIGASIIMIGIGVLLSLTVIGAIIGIPLAIIGIIQLVLSPFTGALFAFKKCPYCKAGILMTRWQNTAKCPKCKNRLIVRGKQLEVVNTQGATHPSNADELAKLAKLKKDGDISEEEFDSQKKRLLGR